METLDIYNTKIFYAFIFSILCLLVLLIPKLISRYNLNLATKLNAYFPLLTIIGLIIGGIIAIGVIIFLVYIIITK